MRRFADPAGGRRARSAVPYVAVSLAVSAVFLGLLFRQVRAAEVGRLLAGIAWPWVGAYVLAALAGSVARAGRYRMFLPADRRPGWPPMLAATFIRNSFVDLLPAKLGALSFVAVANRRLGVPLEEATSTFVVSFVYDFLTLGPYLGAAALLAAARPGGAVPVALLAAAGIFFLACALVLRKLDSAARLLLGMTRAVFAASGWATTRKAEAFERGFAAAVDSLRDAKGRAGTAAPAALSFLVRGAKYASVFFLLRALLPAASPRIDAGLMVLGLTGAELTSALPVKGLAGFGTWETAWALTFRLLGVDPALAIVTGIGVHLLTNVFEYGLGILSLVALAPRKTRAPQPSRTDVFPSLGSRRGSGENG